MKKPKKKDFINKDPLDVDMEEEDEVEEMDEEPVKVVPKKKKKKHQVKIGLDAKDKRDVVKDLNLSDID